MQIERIRWRGLKPRFHDEGELALTALPRIVALVGTNGEGKTSLLEGGVSGSLYRTTPSRGNIKSAATARDSFVEATIVNGQRFTIRQSLDAVSGKGEALVTNGSGEPALQSTSIREYQAWSATHLPPPEVFFASVFAAQGTGGLLSMTGGERKRVLTRALGIERYEAMSKDARERARGSKAKASELAARLADERGRGGDSVELQAQLSTAEDEDGRARIDVQNAELTLADVDRLIADHAEARNQFELDCAHRGALEERAGAARARVADLESRIRNNQAALANADAIRAAERRGAELDAELPQLQTAAAEAKQAEREAVQRIEQLERDIAQAEQAARAAQGRADAARARLADREQVEGATQELPRLREEQRLAWERATEAAEQLRALTGQRNAGADERIGQLRGGLERVIEAPSCAVDTARTALNADDLSVSSAKQLPIQIAEAQEFSHAADLALNEARHKRSAAERLAALAPGLEAAERDLEAAELEQAQNDGRRDGKREQLNDARGYLLPQLRANTGETADRHQAAVAERTALTPLLRQVEPLAKAEARIAELTGQAEAARQELAQLTADLEAAPAPVPPPAAPERAPLQAALEQAQRAARDANAAVAVARQRLQDAEQSAERAQGLEAELRAVEADLADWVRLADDLGADGLQALEIDAAGPALTAMVNDLLHVCYGPRYTMSIETTRRSADNKRDIEDLPIRVLDTVNGMDEEARDNSGGQRVLLGEALSLAITMLVCQRSGAKRPTLIRDESGAALSPENIAPWVSMLRRAAEILDASNIIYVSQSPEAQALADCRVYVEDGLLRVEE